MNVLRRKKPKQIDAIHNPVWKMILQRTLQIREAEREEERWIRRNNQLVSFNFLAEIH